MFKYIKSKIKLIWIRKLKNDNKPDFDDIEFIWGVKSGDDLSGSPASIYTMNDIDITHHIKDGIYALSIETIYVFDNYYSEKQYILGLYKAFTEFMNEKGYDKRERLSLGDFNDGINFEGSIEELYTKFSKFVFGF